jgi:Holliday junction resolvase RusA-like endonuclease
MFSVSFTVWGDPVPKGRPKFRRIGNFTSTYTPAKTKAYETLVKEEGIKAMNGPVLETAITAYISIYLKVPASYSKKRTTWCLCGAERPTKKPDLDNVIKAIFDSLNDVVYKDDSQIVYVQTGKYYSNEPRVDITFKELVE